MNFGHGSGGLPGSAAAANEQRNGITAAAAPTRRLAGRARNRSRGWAGPSRGLRGEVDNGTQPALPDAGEQEQGEQVGSAGLTLRGLVGVGAGGDGGQAGRSAEQPHLAGAAPAQDAVDAVGGQQSWRFTFALGALGAALLRVGAAHGGGGAVPWGRGGLRRRGRPRGAALYRRDARHGGSERRPRRS